MKQFKNRYIILIIKKQNPILTIFQILSDIDLNITFNYLKASFFIFLYLALIFSLNSSEHLENM